MASHHHLRDALAASIRHGPIADGQQLPIELRLSVGRATERVLQRVTRHTESGRDLV